MVNFRLYRIAFAPTLLAVVALMFSLQGAPSALEPARPPAAFDPAGAMVTAREIVAVAPSRPAGSEGDAAVADLVAERFATVRAGSVSEQDVSATIDGAAVMLRNIILTLPGESREAIVVLAGRDSPEGPGAASSAAATAALVELAATLGVTSHRKTYVLASTSGGTAGAGAARDVVEALDPASVEAVLVISQPGAATPRPPFVIATSTGPSRTAAQLEATAAQAVEAQAQLAAPRAGPPSQLARLALPAGLGAQAPLIEAGFDAIAISSAGERPLDPAGDDIDDLSREVLGDFGRAATSTVEAIDLAGARLERGPQPYVEVGDNLVPGWSLALLGLALLCPALVAAVDAAARSLRRSEPLGSALAWAGSLALPALGGLGALYLLALVGLVPRPAFPFDPGQYEIGVRAAVAILLVGGVTAASAILSRGSRRPARLPRSSLIAAVGVIAVAAGAVAWLANPYLGLLVVPAAHVWLVAGVAPGRGRVALAAVAAGASLLPLAFALAEVASELDLGASAPWTLMIMVADGQIGFLVALSLCLLAGALAGTVAASRDRPASARSTGE
jgi:hypothetical protein